VGKRVKNFHDYVPHFLHGEKSRKSFSVEQAMVLHENSWGTNTLSQERGGKETVNRGTGGGGGSSNCALIRVEDNEKNNKKSRQAEKTEND